MGSKITLPEICVIAMLLVIGGMFVYDATHDTSCSCTYTCNC